ncbi:uncharacterized protein LOC116211594 [Punica granatum]|uniref:Uncharacterized protein LOC116211594 n=2 Tax=Punica granatum TaxID=22663 RepID=A0A6P8E9L2_PUNGR|nr:uncharacterized protein LOC116211594 [Punica granatum]
MVMAIPSKLLSLAILCFLLILDCQLLLPSRAARMHHQHPPGHGNNEIGVRGHNPKSDGSHVSRTPTTSHSPNTPTPTTSRPSSRYISYGALKRTRRKNSPGSPPPPHQDPLDAYHFNCTVCKEKLKP